MESGVPAPDLIAAIAPPLRFQEAGKIRELVKRTPTRWTLGEQQAFEFGLIMGDGRCGIQMMMAQIVALKERTQRGVSHESGVEG